MSNNRRNPGKNRPHGNTPSKHKTNKGYRGHKIHNKIQKPSKSKPNGIVFTGAIMVTGRGMGFVAIPDKKEDALIQQQNVHTALHGDTVEVKIIKSRKGEQPEGEVTKIITRAKAQFVGTVTHDDNGFKFIADDRKFYPELLINKNLAKNAKEKDKVLVRVLRFTSDNQAQGEVIRVIGATGENTAEMHAIILERGFETEFPADVEAEARRLSQTEKPIPTQTLATRKDMRKTWTITIDPKDAKDFDDAISFKDLGNNMYEIGVHIADVSYYVRPNTKLDAEAYKRATSVYLVDRTIPMLPEVLSNDLCSLNPHEDKLAFSSIFVLDKHGHVKERWFGRTIINSAHRFTYETAQESIDSPNGTFHKELTILNGIAKELRKEKMNKGAIDFETEEVYFELDAKGKPLGVHKKARLDTHKLVEEYMLLANREVAEYFFKAGKKINFDKHPFIYRIHDTPKRDKIAELSAFVHALGYSLPIDKHGIVTAKNMQALFAQLEGKAEENMVKTAAVRSMAKAIYATKNIGHFGLAFEYYTHFTSPIRRYPDLIVHRLLQAILDDKQVPKETWYSYDRAAEHSTTQEIAAADAERASKKYKQVEFMESHVGEIFDGVVSGVTEWGMYVEEKETKAEGMVRIRDIGDDFYVLDPKQYALVGQKTKKKFSLGDNVKVKLVGADLEKRVLDYKLV